MYTIRESHPHDEHAKPLLNELSAILKTLTGSDGRDSFGEWEQNEGSVFVIAYDGDEPVGCGALRYLGENVAEIKRMYSGRQGKGIGKTILAYLENYALKNNIFKIILETRIVNHHACIFYDKAGYKRIENFGRYKGREECACFEKIFI